MRINKLPQSITWRLYCGRQIPGSDSIVSEFGFEDFCKTVITPKFSAFTIYKADGYWEGYAEPNFIVEITTDENLAQVSVFDIANKYRIRYAQNAVLVTDGNDSWLVEAAEEKAA